MLMMIGANGLLGQMLVENQPDKQGWLVQRWATHAQSLALVGVVDTWHEQSPLARLDEEYRYAGLCFHGQFRYLHNTLLSAVGMTYSPRWCRACARIINGLGDT